MTDSLDLAALQAIRGRNTDLGPILDRIAEHFEEHDGFLAWSGGKDSTAVLALARMVEPNVPVVFYDCGLEFPENLCYIRDLTNDWSLNLDIIRTQPDLLTALVAAGDFDPDSPTRRLPFSLRERMISEPAQRAHTRFGRGSLWGVRSAESSSRRIMYRHQLNQEVTRSCHGCCSSPQQQLRRHGGLVRRVDETVTFGPIWNWTTEQVWELLHAERVPTNPVYDKLIRLGADAQSARVDALIDPAHLHDGQLTRLRAGWPDLFERLQVALPRLTDLI